MGAQVYGPPATLAKGRKALHGYCSSQLAMTSPNIVEASGISRLNRISAQSMIKALDRFHPFRDLMRREGPQWYKTGTLNGIHTRAGYLRSKDGLDYRFVIMLNTAGKRTEPIMEIIENSLR
jgi:D-alanyl-D-alanine carboxypeptidase/D-alanyl-D-alanine-endopeptidase (penicillin-binding protein 4)